MSDAFYNTWSFYHYATLLYDDGWMQKLVAHCVSGSFSSVLLAANDVTDGDMGASGPPGKLNVKTGPPLIDILIFNIF